MNSKRLISVASLINKEDKVIDVGCDHGYLGIYLYKNKLCEDILLTDLRENALNSAINNIDKEKLNISTMLTNGLENINLDKYNTICLCGMGTSTILDILSKLKDNKTINKLIIQSNNDLDILRKEVSNLGFKLDDEITLEENNIHYVICKFIKGSKNLSNEELLFGLVKDDKKDYYNYLINYYKELLNKIPKNNIDYNKVLEKYNILNNIIEKM